MVKDLTQISVVKIYNKKLNLNSILGQQGFTLIEIMVALVLIVIIVTQIPSAFDFSQNKLLKESIDKIDRAVRASIDESILRNSIVRIRFDLDSEPIEYFVEYGEGSDLVLPENKDLSRLSLSEKKIEMEKSKKFDSQFKLISEFSDSAATLPEEIRIFGIGSSYSKDLIYNENVSIYFYPTGEKDSAVIFFYSEEQLATLKISPFETQTFDEYYTFSEQDLENIEYSLESKTKDIFDKWIKE